MSNKLAPPPKLSSEWILAQVGNSLHAGGCKHTAYATFRLEVRDQYGERSQRVVELPDVRSFNRDELLAMKSGEMKRPSRFPDDLLDKGIEAINESYRRDRAGNPRIDVI